MTAILHCAHIKTFDLGAVLQTSDDGYRDLLSDVLEESWIGENAKDNPERARYCIDQHSKEPRKLELSDIFNGRIVLLSGVVASFGKGRTVLVTAVRIVCTKAFEHLVASLVGFGREPASYNIDKENSEVFFNSPAPCQSYHTKLLEMKYLPEPLSNYRIMERILRSVDSICTS